MMSVLYDVRLHVRWLVNCVRASVMKQGAPGEGRPYNNCLRVARIESLVEEPKAFSVIMIEHPHPFLVRLDSARAVVIQWLPVLSINSQTLMSELSARVTFVQLPSAAQISLMLFNTSFAEAPRGKGTFHSSSQGSVETDLPDWSIDWCTLSWTFMSASAESG